MRRCPYCGANKVIIDSSGEVKCTNCGAVLAERPIDPGPEWRAYDAEQYMKRARAAKIDLVGVAGGVPITVVYGAKDGRGATMGSESLAKSRRIARLQKRGRSALERSLQVAHIEMHAALHRLGLPVSVREDAMLIVRRALERGLARGRSVKLLVAIALYHAAKTRRVPVTPEEVARALGLDKEHMLGFYKVLQEKEVITSVTPSMASDFVNRIVSRVKLSPRVLKVAKDLVRAAEVAGVALGKPPRTVAAASVYIATKLLGETCSRRDIARAVSISDATLRARAKEIQRAIDIVVTV